MKRYKVFHRPKLSAAKEGIQEMFHIVEAAGIIDARNKARDLLEIELDSNHEIELSSTLFKVPGGSEDIFEIVEDSHIDICKAINDQCNKIPLADDVSNSDSNDDELLFDDFDFDDLGIDYTAEEIDSIINSLEPGESEIIYDLPDSIYHAVGGYSSSNLKLIAKSPALFKWMQSCEAKSEPEAFTFGKAFHCAMLEPDRFKSDYVVAPNADGRKPKEIEALKQFQLDNSDKICIQEKTMTLIHDMHKSAFCHESVKKIVINPEFKSEVSIFWKCPDTKLVFKIRCDGISEVDGRHVIFDLKTATDTSKIKWNIRDYGYHMQAFFYSYIYEKAIGVEPDFVLCFVSKTLSAGRHEVRVGRLIETNLQEGEAVFNQALNNILNYSDELHLEEF